ncbi:hypothetical protein BGZ51_004446 [Haplosporangium sp. Z 767]|nr:hypothetical protein BGZ51_004446 [Haplosporangium sp. Z 767]
MSDASEALTLTLEDDIQDLPEDEGVQEKDTDVVAVSLISLNPIFKSITLTKNKTIMEKCTEGAILTGKMISGTHCEISSRSMTDMDAAIWIKDTSSNGVWVNENRLIKDEPTKIVNKDIISFASRSLQTNGDTPVYVLIDERKKSTFKNQQQENAKRINEELGIDSSAKDFEPEKKKQKTEANTTDKEDKEKEESAFEKEFECGICHEIMHKALVLQPCLHSFCRECCKAWLQNSTVCPSCRERVTMTKRDFKINNLITLFIKGRPHLARDDVEDDGADSDSSNVVLRNRRNRDSDDGDDDDDDGDDDEYSDDDNDGRNARLPPGFNGHPPTCPCCDPNNTLGYVCPDAVRLGPLPLNATYADYLARRSFQPGHTQCRDCRTHLPILPQTTQDPVADRFRCKVCCVPSCGCQLRSVEDNITRSVQILGYLNDVEERIINDYLARENMTPQNVWQEVKDGMDNGTLRYLGTSAMPVTAASNTSALPVTTDDGTAPPGINIDVGSDSNSTAPSATATTVAATVGPDADATTSVPISAAAGMLPLLSPLPPLSRMNRAQTVTSSDKLCRGCSREFLSNGPLYQWRKNLDPTKFPVQVTTRESCWWGRECRTQYNQANPTHAERLNHICEKTLRR